MVLDSTILKLEIVLAGAVAASQPEIHVDYLVWSQNEPATPTKPFTYRTASNNSTDVVILPAPTTQGVIFEPIQITVYNKDSASVTATIKTDDATTERIIVKQVITTLKSLCWEKALGWYII